MKVITIIGVNYYPEDTAIGLYTTQLAEYLAKNGFKVNLITGFPYYPSWEIKNEYRNKKTFLKETINDVEVYRYKQYVPKKPTFFKRIIHLLDFTFGSLINIFKIKNTDLVVCIIPFTSTIILGKILAVLKKAKLWVHIQDFEFDAAAQSDMIKNNENKILLKFIFKIESLLLNRADSISTISKSMLDKLNKKTKNNSNHLLPNWVNLTEINPDKAINHKYLNSNKFKILYSGNIGEKQDWYFFLELAKKLDDKSNIEIVIIGDGAKKEWLLEELKKLTNVSYYEPVAYKNLSNLLCSADIHILFQKGNIIDTVMPSKILAMMASEKPSIITGNLKSEVASIINESKGGMYFESNDLKGVILGIEELMNDSNKAVHLGMNSRKYVTNNFSNQKILNKFKESFSKITQNS